MSNKLSQLVNPGSSAKGKFGALVVSALVLAIVVQNPHASGDVVAHVFHGIGSFARSLHGGGQ